jgi:hypothetical protein
MRSHSHRIGLILLMGAGTLTGCGGDRTVRVPVHPADGLVVQKGKPVPHAFVRFHPVNPDLLKPPEGSEADAVMLTTETDENGQFVLSTYLADDGIPAGAYTVTVAVPSREPDVEHSDGKPATRPKGIAVPAALRKYSEPATSPFRATVQAGGPNHFQFHLE